MFVLEDLHTESGTVLCVCDICKLLIYKFLKFHDHRKHFCFQRIYSSSLLSHVTTASATSLKYRQFQNDNLVKSVSPIESKYSLTGFFSISSLCQLVNESSIWSLLYIYTRLKMYKRAHFVSNDKIDLYVLIYKTKKKKSNALQRIIILQIKILVIVTS